jgi:predicted TIM-barrel fold metal-dependent hydrolase
MWASELRGWMPDKLFDAHVHLGPPAAMKAIRDPLRLKEAKTTFTSFSAEELFSFYENLYSGKSIAGLIAFPFPLLEVNYEIANQYIAGLMQKDPRVNGFILSNPYDTRSTIRQYEEARRAGIRFRGVKPYYDLLGKAIPYSVLHTSIAEFVPENLLEFVNDENLLLMLHTSRIGMGDPECQEWVIHAVKKYPRVKIILAHMGRYYEPKQFEDFMRTDVLNQTSIFLEVSSASLPEIYKLTLGRPYLRERLLFGSDLPFGAITGVEYSDERTISTFITRDHYEWTDPEVAVKFETQRKRLTYNTYHVIKAIKTAIEELALSEAQKLQVKNNVFNENAQNLLASVQNLTSHS